MLYKKLYFLFIKDFLKINRFIYLFLYIYFFLAKNIFTCNSFCTYLIFIIVIDKSRIKILSKF